MLGWLQETFLSASAVQAVIVICLICAAGLALGKLRFKGVSLGVTYVFLLGILAGALGLRVDAEMLSYAESFGLILFVYALGLQVGPGFMSTFRKGGTSLNLLAFAVVVLGTLLALVPAWTGTSPLSDMMGVLCGATTNTPALGAAQQTLKQLGQPSAGAALSCAVTYPLGLVGVILALMIMKGWLVRHEAKGADDDKNDETFIASFHVCNPAIYGKLLRDLSGTKGLHIVVSRLWRDGKVLLPNGDTRLQEGDRLLVITEPASVEQLTIFFGRRDDTDWNKAGIDWNALDSQLISQRILITRPEINGRHLGSLHLRNRYGVNVSRVQRAGKHSVFILHSLRNRNRIMHHSGVLFP